jgi:hypothetical protein
MCRDGREVQDWKKDEVLQGSVSSHVEGRSRVAGKGMHGRRNKSKRQQGAGGMQVLMANEIRGVKAFPPVLVHAHPKAMLIPPTSYPGGDRDRCALALPAAYARRT